MEKYICKGLEDTNNVAKGLAKKLAHGDVICLDGDLGAGKTAFSGFLLKALGVHSNHITSPTFSIVNEYYIDKMTIYHFDVYRLGDYNEIFECGFDEFIYSDNISVIEWAEKVLEALPKKRYEIKICKDLEKGEDYREIFIDRKG